MIDNNEVGVPDLRRMYLQEGWFGCLAAYVIKVEANKPLKLLIGNFGTYPIQVHKNQVKAGLLPHPNTVEKGPIIMGEILGIEENPSTDPKKGPHKG